MTAQRGGAGSRLLAGLTIVLALMFGFTNSTEARVVPVETLHMGAAMQVVLVKNANPNCAGTCSDWISAEGTIVPGTIGDFIKIFLSMGNQKLPIFLNSRGGSLETAMRLGRMFHARQMDVFITRTRFIGCAPTDPTCEMAPGLKVYRGQAISSGALCASACAVMIAGAEHRFVPRESRVGVHDITPVEGFIVSPEKKVKRKRNGKTIEITDETVSAKVADRSSDKIISEIKDGRERVARYYQEMGVSDEIVRLSLATKPTSIHWVTLKELRESRLATDFIGGEMVVGLRSKRVPPPVPVVVAAKPPEPPTIPKPVPSQPDASASVEIATAPKIPIDIGYFMDLTFEHTPGQSTVNWSAIIREGDIVQPKAHFAARLELTGGRRFSASPSITDSPFSVSLRGEMDLRNYCDLAGSNDVSIRLTAPRPLGGGMREIVSPPESLSLPQPLWPACQAARSVTAQAPTP